MRTVNQTNLSVKSTRGPGRPPLRTSAKERDIIRACVKAALITGQMPGDEELAEGVGLGERTVRGIRLRAGLNRRHIAEWVKARETALVSSSAEEVLCWTPWAGLWLLVPLMVRSALLPAARLLRWTTRTGIDAGQWVLTVMMWALLGFRRFFHLDDFRHRADLGLALFTGRVRLLADSTVWRLVHSLNPESSQAFYQQTAAEAVPLDAPQGEEWLSMDEHVVGFFTKLKPHPLGKTRVPTRGRSYPAIRLYAPFHLWAGRFVGLVVTRARRALSQVLPALISEVRQLRQLAGHPQAQCVDVILDRGGYKGSLFESLMADDAIRFIAMARATKKNVPQWEAVPEEAFQAYQPQGEQNPNLKIAEATTQITDCRYPLRTVLIRDDTPDTRQRWRSLLTKVSAQEMTPAEVDATYRRRQDHENSFADLDHHLAGKCLPKPYRLLRQANDQGQKRKTTATTLSTETLTGLHLVAWLRHWTYNLVKDFGGALGGPYATMQVGTLVRKFIARPGFLRLKGHELQVTLMPFTGSQVLKEWIQQINEQQISIPWLAHLTLQIEMAPLPLGQAANPRAVRRRIFANHKSVVVT
jgi:hypothetical protein